MPRPTCAKRRAIRPVVTFGAFVARIGPPTNSSASRPLLTPTVLQTGGRNSPSLRRSACPPCGAGEVDRLRSKQGWDDAWLNMVSARSCFGRRTFARLLNMRAVGLSCATAMASWIGSVFSKDLDASAVSVRQSRSKRRGASESRNDVSHQLDKRAKHHGQPGLAERWGADLICAYSYQRHGRYHTRAQGR